MVLVDILYATPQKGLTRHLTILLGFIIAAHASDVHGPRLRERRARQKGVESGQLLPRQPPAPVKGTRMHLSVVHELRVASCESP